jgi:hypothetical protein
MKKVACCAIMYSFIPSVPCRPCVGHGIPYAFQNRPEVRVRSVRHAVGMVNRYVRVLGLNGRAETTPLNVGSSSN